MKNRETGTMKLRAGLLAAAFAMVAPAAMAQQGTLRVGMAAQDMGRLDPHFAVSTIDRVPMPWMFNGLVTFPP